MNSKHLVLEVGSPRGRFSVWLSPLPSSQPDVPSLCLTRWKGLGNLSEVFVYQGARPIRGGLMLMTHSPPKGPRPDTVTSGVRISTSECKGGDTNIQSTADGLTPRLDHQLSVDGQVLLDKCHCPSLVR